MNFWLVGAWLWAISGLCWIVFANGSPAIIIGVGCIALGILWYSVAKTR